MLASEQLKANSTSTIILLNSYGMGSAEEPLRLKLLRIYLALLEENRFHPGAICFYGEGVKLVVQGSPVLDALRALESKGVRLIVCVTCLKYYGLEEKVAVGIVGGMGDIMLAQWAAGKVITL